MIWFIIRMSAGSTKELRTRRQRATKHAACLMEICLDVLVIGSVATETTREPVAPGVQALSRLREVLCAGVEVRPRKAAVEKRIHGA